MEITMLTKQQYEQILKRFVPDYKDMNWDSLYDRIAKHSHSEEGKRLSPLIRENIKNGINLGQLFPPGVDLDAIRDAMLELFEPNAN